MNKLRQTRWLEWPTLALFFSTYLLFAIATIYAQYLPSFAIIVILAILLTIHSSLQHETIHILEPQWPVLSILLASPALGMVVPYSRFRDLHLAHHINEQLTDPFDDPETGYYEATFWMRFPNHIKIILQFNNTLLGRILIGPLIGTITFIQSDLNLIFQGNKQVFYGWLRFIPALMIVLLWLYYFGTVQVWEYAIAAYSALSILKIRTFIEHRAHSITNARSVIVSDRGILSILFLNNNFHAVHHSHPSVPWYNLPSMFKLNKNKFLTSNDNYYYKNYFTVFKKYLLVKKEKLVHPYWNLQNRTEPIRKEAGN